MAHRLISLLRFIKVGFLNALIEDGNPKGTDLEKAEQARLEAELDRRFG